MSHTASVGDKVKLPKSRRIRKWMNGWNQKNIRRIVIFLLISTPKTGKINSRFIVVEKSRLWHFPPFSQLENSPLAIVKKPSQSSAERGVWFLTGCCRRRCESHERKIIIWRWAKKFPRNSIRKASEKMTAAKKGDKTDDDERGNEFHIHERGGCWKSKGEIPTEWHGIVCMVVMLCCGENNTVLLDYALYTWLRISCFLYLDADGGNK